MKCTHAQNVVTTRDRGENVSWLFSHIHVIILFTFLTIEFVQYSYISFVFRKILAIMIFSRVFTLFLASFSVVEAFQLGPILNFRHSTTTCLSSVAKEPSDGRRAFLSQTSAAILCGILTSTVALPQEAKAIVYLDPAMYGDQENRISAVDSLKESVRRSILQKPQLAPIFYSMALLDGLSYNAKTNAYGPDGRIVTAVLESTDKSPYVSLMKDAAQVLVESKKSLKKLTSITIADAVALAGTEGVAAVGGPNLSIQVGRTDAPKGSKYNPDIPIDLFSGNKSADEIRKVFQTAGMTEREMTALLGCLLTLEVAEKETDSANWAKSDKPKFVERGKMGRMSDYKRLTDEDIASELAKDGVDEDDEPGLFDDEPYIADTFGTKDQAFGKKAGSLNEKNFNLYIIELNKYMNKGSKQPYGWIGDLLVDKASPGTQQYVSKYAKSYLNYEKDLRVSFNSMTQLGGEFTGGKYDSLLRDRPRKTLNDD